MGAHFTCEKCHDEMVLEPMCLACDEKEKALAVDYKVLLKKYITYLTDVEGCDFINPHDLRMDSDVVFTEWEWQTLLAMSKEAEECVEGQQEPT